MLLDIFGVNSIFLYALIAAFFKTVPFLSTWMVGLVAALQYLLQVWPGWDAIYSLELLKAIALFCFYFAIDYMMATDMPLRHVNRVDPTALYMSVFLGLY